jgi:NAD(P)-dependent dehydrogenase (short-subunit alcohol dehydrogenase family)
MRFENKIAVITGGGSGIGLATARALAAEGARVVLGGRDQAKLAAAASGIDPTGARVATLTGDIARPETGAALVALAESRFGGLDILVNNAGVFRPKPFLDLDEAEYDWFLDTILKGKFFTAQAAARAMRRRGGGAIVQTGSMWAELAIGATPSAAYSAANAGVHAMVRNLAIELAPERIRVNAVAPAVVETPVYETFIPADQVATAVAGFNGFHPLGRNGQPQDIAAAILFLASDAAGWITGTVMKVDGGVTAGRH